MQAIVKKGAQHGHVAFGRVSLISNQEKPAHAATPRLQYETHHNLGSTELLHPMQAIIKKGGAAWSCCIWPRQLDFKSRKTCSRCHTSLAIR
ncbi:hypothetical protein, partial [Agrobacterium tumefaciens]